jgi:hypothetical protein
MGITDFLFGHDRRRQLGYCRADTPKRIRAGWWTAADAEHWPLQEGIDHLVWYYPKQPMLHQSVPGGLRDTTRTALGDCANMAAPKLV